MLTPAVENSLFGQAPYVINANRSTFECALQDYALFHGVLALACLGRDINQDMRASHLCLKLKGLTIKAVRQRLSADSINIAVGTIGAIAALAAFDLLECLGRNEARPDSMSFLHLAVSRKGGLSQLATEGRGPCGHAELLKRIILWLDLSFAIMDETPSQFAFYDAPLHLPSIALHTVSLHMTPLQIVFAELSQLSRFADETGKDLAAEATDSGRKALADQVTGMEQYATNLGTAEVSPQVLEIIRLTTFLYSARYIRQFSSSSRIQMQLAVRLQRRLATEFRHACDTGKLELLSWQGKPDQCPSYQAVIVWAATVAANSSGSFKEICGCDHQERRAFWKDHIISMLERFEIGSIGVVETTVGNLTHDTEACRKDRRLLLQACGVKES
jgi:Fungal specific transcription factor domain